MEEERIPSWLFFGLHAGMEKQGKWTEEKERVARVIVQHLRDHSRSRYWKPEVLETVLHFNKYDDANMYGITPHSK